MWDVGVAEGGGSGAGTPTLVAFLLSRCPFFFIVSIFSHAAILFWLRSCADAAAFLHYHRIRSLIGPPDLRKIFVCIADTAFSPWLFSMFSWCDLPPWILVSADFMTIFVVFFFSFSNSVNCLSIREDVQIKWIKRHRPWEKTHVVLRTRYK